MTIPTLTKNIQEREYLTAAKRINSMISNSIAFVEANDGIRSASDAEDFVENYLKQYLKISKICGYDNVEACGFITKTNGIHRIDDMRITLPTQIDDLQTDMVSTGQTLNSIDRRGFSFLTSNGYSMILFYNPNCLSDSSSGHYVQDRVCINILWDMNGLADPNTAAKDIGFTTVLYPKYSNTVTPVAYTTSTNVRFDLANAKCLSYAGEHYKVPNRDELASLYFNGALINQTSGHLWSSESVSDKLVWLQYFANGFLGHEGNTSSATLRCVRK